MVSFFTFKNKLIYKNGQSLIANNLITTRNSAAIGGNAKWGGGLNFTSVGSNGRSSYYGTYDQTGNCFEWVDVNSTTKAIRGGDLDGWASQSAGYDATKTTRYIKTAAGGSINPPRFVSVPNKSPGKPQDRDWGGRIATSTNPLNLPDFVQVGDAGNSADTTGYGAVSYTYSIGKYTITNTEYCAFLNAVASTDTYSLYSTQMSTERVGGILRSGSSGSYTYSIKPNYENKPVYFLSWFALARYCNWLHNTYGSTETGAYTLNGAMTGIIQKNAGALYWIPSENEWYKAAYYKGNGTNAGYWRFATQSNGTPIAVFASNIGDGSIKKLTLSPVVSTGTNITTAPVADNSYGTTVSVTYENISSTGVTKISPMPAFSSPALPANFYVSNSLARYNISTTSSFSGLIDIAFTMPSTLSSGTFSKTRIFHHEAGKPNIDVTILSGVNSPNFATRTIWARVSGFSDINIITEQDVDNQSSAPTGSPTAVGGPQNIAVSSPVIENESTYGIRYSAAYEYEGNTYYISQEYHKEFIENNPDDIIIDGLEAGVSYTVNYYELTPDGSTQASPPSSPVAPTESSYNFMLANADIIP